MKISSIKEQALNMQGFSCTVESDLGADIIPWLRFTPALSTGWIFLGTVLASPVILWLFAILSGISAARTYHFFDWIYNQWVRKLTKTSKLPINPKPRRFSMLLAALWSLFTGLLFMAGFSIAGYMAGFLLIIAGASVAITHVCLGSFIYRIWERAQRKNV